MKILMVVCPAGGCSLGVLQFASISYIEQFMVRTWLLEFQSAQRNSPDWSILPRNLKNFDNTHVCTSFLFFGGRFYGAHSKGRIVGVVWLELDHCGLGVTTTEQSSSRNRINHCQLEVETRLHSNRTARRPLFYEFILSLWCCSGGCHMFPCLRR